MHHWHTSRGRQRKGNRKMYSKEISDIFKSRRTQKSRSRNLKDPTPRHIISKLKKVKEKRHPKAAREK
jgi:hypothetical protein